MRTLLLLLIFSFYGHLVFAQSGLLSPKGVSFPIYTTGGRPAANSVGIGTVLYNTTDNTHQFSNGSTWLNLLGTTALPSGFSGQTLRNNGSGWVVDNNIVNDGQYTRIGSATFGDITLAVGYGHFTGIHADGEYFGVFGNAKNSSGTGVKGYSSNIGVFGESIGMSGTGVKGTSPSGYGMYGYSNTGSGIYGISNYGSGVFGESAFGYAGKFKGSVIVGALGTTPATPLAPLHVQGSNVVATASAYYTNYGYNGATPWYLTSSSQTWATGLLVDYDIVGKRSIVSTQNVTTSDARIKNILGISDNQQDLVTLRRLKITDYRYKDVANWGNQTFKKVIAQQVEEVYPQAVRKQTSTIPDIYCLAEKVVYDESKKELTVKLSKDYGIKTGDKIDLIHAEKGKMQVEVITVSGNDFTVKDWLYPTDKIFVFGRQVDDFRVVDYEALSMLGISAIQQLAKEVEELKSQNTQLKTDFTARLEAIETLLLKSQTQGNNHEK